MRATFLAYFPLHQRGLTVYTTSGESCLMASMRGLTWGVTVAIFALLGGAPAASCQAQAADPESSTAANGTALPRASSGNSLTAYSWRVDSVPSGIQLVTLFAELPGPSTAASDSDRVPVLSL